jgi:hypothetical protein
MLFGSQTPPVVVPVVVPLVLVPVVDPPVLVPVVVVVVVVVVVLDVVLLVDPPVVVPVEVPAGSLEQATKAHEAIRVSAIFMTTPFQIRRFANLLLQSSRCQADRPQP